LKKASRKHKQHRRKANQHSTPRANAKRSNDVLESFADVAVTKAVEGGIDAVGALIEAIGDLIDI